ncbi:MAG: CRISPR system Cascade subunit CasE [Verrucomicrobia bacterium]|nr:MAG: CRISPR system Cascade subunit CasE [Verrucomicrobiota bacterium]
MSLHLTKIEIDYETAHKAGLRDAYAWHQWAWQAFPGRPEVNRDFLTRLDDTGDGFRFLIQSTTPPQRPGTCPLNAWQTKDIPENFFGHQAYRFSLLANPTRKLAAPRDADGKRRNAKRLPVSNREDLIAWIERKGVQHGFRIDPTALQTIPRPRQVFVKKSNDDSRRYAGLHGATEFVGILKITDPALFVHAAHNGIGSAKAFGFGMLCLSPI